MGNNDLFYMLGGVFYIGFEFWIGKTEKTKASSLVEALIFGAKFAYNRMKKGAK